MHHIVPVSGGKDSTATALRLAEIEPRDYTYICTPTGDEPPEFFAHLNALGKILGKPILPIMHRLGLNGLIREQNALPNWRQRWCTRILKIEPYAAWLMQHSPAVSYVGIRYDEEEREGGDYSKVTNVEVDFPLRRWKWGLEEVWGYLHERKITIPKRTDCRRCFYQRLIEWYEFWRDDPAAYADAEQQEQTTGYTFRSPGRDTWPAALKDLRAEFEKGRVPKETRKTDLIAGTQCRVCRM